MAKKKVIVKKTIKQPYVDVDASQYLPKTYSLVLSLNGKQYTAEGDNLGETILSIKPEFFKTKGVLRVKKGNREVQRILIIPQMKRLFGVGGTNTQKFAVIATEKFLQTMLS